MILLSIYDVFWIATITGAFIIGAYLLIINIRNRKFRKRCLTAEISKADPIIGYFYVGEEKYHSVLRSRMGERLTIEFRDENGIQSRSINIREFYPAW
jgi:hypothetical protein